MLHLLLFESDEVITDPLMQESKTKSVFPNNGEQNFQMSLASAGNRKICQKPLWGEFFLPQLEPHFYTSSQSEILLSCQSSV